MLFRIYDISILIKPIKKVQEKLKTPSNVQRLDSFLPFPNRVNNDNIKNEKCVPENIEEPKSRCI